MSTRAQPGACECGISRVNEVPMLVGGGAACWPAFGSEPIRFTPPPLGVEAGEVFLCPERSEIAKGKTRAGLFKHRQVE